MTRKYSPANSEANPASTHLLMDASTHLRIHNPAFLSRKKWLFLDKLLVYKQ